MDAQGGRRQKFLGKVQAVDIAIDAYYSDPAALAVVAARPSVPATSTSKHNTLCDEYKDPDSDDITGRWTIRLCQDLGVDPEDVILPTVAFELNLSSMSSLSNRLGSHRLCTRHTQSHDSLKSSAHSTAAMKTALRTKVGQDSAHFQEVYNHTFEFAKAPDEYKCVCHSPLSTAFHPAPSAF
ncbi:hypothetical protein K438DRAFT_1974684 [Mycena galopus ATCC 62051]|nr:hypothetical protein K438DRAFT_1974684 [Mycena galopus ATCC 62051]